MDAAVLKAVGQVAGIGGLALGVFLILFREIIRKKIFPKLPPAEAYRLLRLIVIAVWSVAVVGVAAWVYSSQGLAKAASADHGSVAIGGDVSGSTVENKGSGDTTK
ncbi:MULTISPECIES: hypothetical protein [unclassified Mesorhizobium]|uniref:hypothetical protein n=1 Tax=unclassified Mesorhizobium TaxID=325217 RepID=UPI002416C20B|nr:MULTISPECIES: hypothetical protein [unclassified Mesorhizobium]WFP63372.1 hypothetical protein QAZ47_01960 [Mesorhizobium sp. WSM4904]WFP76640.1 hypothetical protein QAZ22_01955 [Mesorhizobium sp. WSM4906]